MFLARDPCKHPKKSYDAELYNKWIMSKSHADEEIVPFVDKLLPGDCRLRDLPSSDISPQHVMPQQDAEQSSVTLDSLMLTSLPTHY